MKHIIFLAIFACVTNLYAAPDKIKIVTTTMDLADIAKEIGGEKVEVTSLSHGDQSGCNSVEPRPSMVMSLRKAGVFVRIGMDYDSWADSLIDACGNSRIAFGAPGYADASVGIERLEVPAGRVDAGMGHVHVYGNPHYWLDPQNGRVMADNILAALIRVSAGNKDYFTANKQAYVARLDDKISQWSRKLEPYKGKRIVSYHESWVYFAKRFGFEIMATIEPKPGIPPSAAYLNQLIIRVKQGTGLLIFHENIYPEKTSAMVARETGAKVYILPISTGGMRGAVKSYTGLFDYIVSAITEDEK